MTPHTTTTLQASRRESSDEDDDDGEAGMEAIEAMVKKAETESAMVQ
jgi:hypothetical protein